MASKVWVLVEWVEESSLLSSYGVVNVDTTAYRESDLQPGNVILVRVPYENPRQGKIMRISKSKQYVLEHKEILERQNQQVKAVLQVCIRSIRDLKSNDPILRFGPAPVSNHIALPHVIVPSNVDRGTDSQPELTQFLESPEDRRLSNFIKSVPIYPQYSRLDHHQGPLNSSTPIPSSSAQQKVIRCYNQGTQTEDMFLRPPVEDVERLEAVLKTLYKRFQSLVAEVNRQSNNSRCLMETDHNDSSSYGESNDGSSCTEYTSTENEDLENATSDRVQEVPDEIDENRANKPMANSRVNSLGGSSPNTLRLRRLSPETTNNIQPLPPVEDDLVAINNGSTLVPSRLLKEIDWRSHTTATRQLLQAIFSRKVLATHSLTGKQSPAFMNRPPKKILDPKRVEDIVKIVSTRCGVPKSLVRNSITIKCTDEAKLYRNRQQYKQQRKTVHENDENRPPPSTPSSDESADAVLNEM